MMKTKILNPALITFLAVAMVSLAPARAVSFDWAAVGDVGNADDVTGYGGVATAYQIATKEVNLIQYTEFLNAVDPTGANTLALYNADMKTDANIAGIDFNSGELAGSKYSVMGNSGLRPVTYVSWNDSARFVNWLQNGQGTGSTETGVYNMTLPVHPVRTWSATYFLPTENEWYKAAYYDPGVTGPADDYWLYPTRSDSEPAGNTIGVANSGNFDDGNSAQDQNSLPTKLTDGGAYTDSESYYGTSDQGGNVWEWNETMVLGSTRGRRGGSWVNPVSDMNSFGRANSEPTYESSQLGFRVASVPEPSAVMLMLAGGAALLARRRRKVTL